MQSRDGSEFNLLEGYAGTLRAICLFACCPSLRWWRHHALPLSGLARQFRTDIQTLFCRRIRGGPSASERARALDRIAGSICLVCIAVSVLWLANQALPATLLHVSLIGESAQAASGAPDLHLPTPEAEAASEPLSADEIRRLQTRLMVLGFDPGPIDGTAGPSTLRALNLYRASVKLDRVPHINRSTVADLAN